MSEPSAPRSSTLRLGIMQPYFFPYAGYFGLMAAADRWIVFDTPQYIRKGWVNRNRVLSTGRDAWKYIRVPVAKAPRETAICDMRLADPRNWLASLIDGLDYYRIFQAPHYESTIELLKEIDRECQEDLGSPGDMTRLLVTSLRCLARHLQVLPEQFDVFSEMKCELPPIEHAGEWALRISEAVGASDYINPIGGFELFDARQFRAANLNLWFYEPELPPYSQGEEPFVTGLSILDALMWLSPSEARDLLTQHHLRAADG